MALKALIISGGQASRMGGCDKGLARYREHALIDCVIERLNLPAANLAISANRNEALYAQRAALVFSDLPLYAGCGPLAALASASVTPLAEEKWLLVVPCDTPHLPQNMAHRFLAAVEQSSGCAAFYASTQARSHYSVMLLGRGLLERAASYLDAGKRSLHGWLEAEHARAVVFPHEADFRNYNTLQDLEYPPC
ncbi:MAG: molybdenum cofactor guanylyltransferase [Neisseria sp.]|uniref:molybdenum cofactor guanylyltransferase n=1 Tax=Neisseria sp. TaxID=192066 RepID=UPI0026DAC1CA|nr:molybdenum cofactor guanylyltransferase [Neisseria sp.]MDO4640143.1 molybdenum cofactor guanylyltransferase [Neisseria sp.]